MSDLSPGQEVTVNATGASAEVVYVRNSSVRIRMIHTGACRTVPLSRVTPKRESKALTISEMAMQWNDAPGMTSRSDEKRRAVLRGEPLPTFGASRPVPKPVTLYSEPYLAYVRKHPCCLCGAPGPSEPHHWSHHGAARGKKCDDYRTVPLCQEHHRYWHDHGTLPGHDRVGSEGRFLRFQRDALADWTAKRVSDGDQVDALIRAIGGADA